MNEPMHILYLASVLPKRSETFVYREVLGLRDRGVTVTPAALRGSEMGLDDARLDALARETLSVYGQGTRRMIRDARPWLGTEAARRGLEMALTEPGVPARYRIKAVAQVIGGLALARRVRDRGITHIHAHFAHAPATVAMVAADALGVPFSFTGHAADLFRDRVLLEPKLRRAAFVSCISQWHRDFYQQVVPGLDAGKLPVVRCGVDVPGGKGPRGQGAEGPSAENQEPPASEHSAPGPLGPSAPLILGVGRLVPKKGFDVLLEAAAGMDARVVIAGEGPEHQRLATLSTRRTELLGALRHPDVVALMNRASLFVLPCRPDAAGDRDGIPVVLMEAMAREVCVVSGDLPTIRELVIDGKTGRLTPPGDAGALRRIMEELLADAPQRRRLARAGRRRVLEEFSSEVNLDRLMAEFSRTRAMNTGGDAAAA